MIRGRSANSKKRSPTTVLPVTISLPAIATTRSLAGQVRCALQEGADTDVLTVAVDPDFRLRGIARHMVTSLIDWAYSKKSPTIFLEVEKNNLAAQALYISEGFTVISMRPDYYGPGIDALVMSKVLE